MADVYLLRRSLLALSLAAAIALAGCATPGGGPVTVPAIDPATITKIQDTAKQVCGFVPTINTVASIIATFTGGGAIVDMVGRAATGICTAVTAKGAKRGGARYRGVVIKGDFAR